MDEKEYQEAIPHVCRYITTQEHMDGLMLCWSITSGRVQKAKYRGVEGPSFCHKCDCSFRAARWDKIWEKTIFKDINPNGECEHKKMLFYGSRICADCGVVIGE